MWVCTCNALSFEDIVEAVTSGAKTPDEIVESCDADFRCETCIPEMEMILKKESEK